MGGDDSEQTIRLLTEIRDQLKRISAKLSNLDDVRVGINELVRYFYDSKPRSPLDDTGKKYSPQKIREEHPQAYQPWTSQEIERVERGHSEGKSIRELAADLGRQPGAIRSRLSKSGLLK
ncbi:MAG: hypothetical protein A3G34_17500 [Candidatus Lindowbacteria bacterium RIFCSPLOWO2_12_FULL_62_27]|nr:MAG: hypothetical protein A3G34_17500 [Candidatus Lindowbacteria bacterium RIFCSPLOWO2_12_FULL_62_27]